MMSEDDSKQEEQGNQPEYVSAKELMDRYSLSRPLVIKWTKEDPDVRYFQSGKFLRIHLGDFENMIDRLVQKSMNKKDEDGE